MTEPEISTRLFGKLVREALGGGPSRVTLAAQRARLVAAMTREAGSGSGHRPGWLFAAALTAAAAACLLLVWGGPLRDDTVHATFRGSPVIESAAMETKPAEAQPLAFSEGSEVTLASATQAELSRLTQTTADLRLKQGRLLANIRKNTGLTWTIAVGPYSVRVVGTRFSVDWDRDQQHLQVAVREGRVRVFGGDLPGDGVALDAGSRLDRRYGEVHSRPAAKPDPAPVTTRTAREATRAPGNPAPAIAPIPNLEPSWLGLATKGKYREALALAEKQGFDQLTLTLPENELVTLANAARFSGDSDRARRALLKLRQRFPGRPAAQLGALYLARVAEDVEKKPTEALRWLRVFLQESPTGDLAASARTSLMNILLNTGDAQGARAIAEDYVRYHPNGRHLSQARALLAQPRPR